MSRREDIQRYQEMNHGRYFIDWVNATYGLDYQSFPNHLQSSDVDVFAESLNQLPKLELQMVTSDGPTEQLMAETVRRLQRGLDIEVKEVKPIEWVSDVIDSKTQKYPDNIKQDLILIIQGFMPTPDPRVIKKGFGKYTDSQFKGIYYVSLPVHSSLGAEDEKNGFVVAIKDCFVV